MAQFILLGHRHRHLRPPCCCCCGWCRVAPTAVLRLLCCGCCRCFLRLFLKIINWLLMSVVVIMIVVIKPGRAAALQFILRGQPPPPALPQPLLRLTLRQRVLLLLCCCFCPAVLTSPYACSNSVQRSLLRSGDRCCCAWILLHASQDGTF